MAIESPVCIGVISRMPEAKVHTAAFLIMFALAMWVESPVIDLLSTSTTLARNRQSYGVLRRFCLWVMLWVTVVHTLLFATPAYGWLTSTVLGLERDVAEAAQIGLLVMIPWSALIGWRRFLQGILIRNGQTRLVGFGTAVRVLTVSVVAIALYLTTSMHSVALCAVALLASVGAEALFIHVVSRETVRRQFSADRPDDPIPPLTMRALLKFHIPLSLTTMAALLGGPIIGAALARTPDSVLGLASWQVAVTLLWLTRTIVFALPEVVITLYKDAASAAVLRRFCLTVGFGTMSVLVLLAVTGLDRVFFARVLDASPETVAMAHIGFFAGVLTPLIGAAQSYLRGLLTAHHDTASRLWATATSIAVLVGALAAGVAMRAPGVLTAAVSLTLALLAELGILAARWRRIRPA